MSNLTVLGEKIAQLLKKYTLLQTEHRKLRKQLGKAMQEQELLKEKIATLEHEALAMNIAKSLPEKKERIAALKQIDSVINEIDKILVKLND